MGKGGGSAPQPTSQTVNQSNLPEYARPYFEDIMTRGTTASNVAYQPYQGERVAGFTPLQEQGFQGVQNLGVSPLVGQGAGMTGAAGLGGLTAGSNYAQQATSPGATAAYMSPYMQNVVDWQKQQAIQDYGRQLPGQQAAATRAGAFGGSRQAIVESEAQRNLQNQLAGIQAQGTQSAFDQARQAQQFGSQLGLQGLGLAGQMGQQFGALGQTAFGQQAAAAQAQQQAGAAQQAQQQDILNKKYEDFMQQTLYPQSQLQFLSSLLRGSVVAPQQTMYSYQAPASMASQIGGLAGGLFSGAKAFGAKDGGEVPGYAEGGITGGAEGQPTTLEVSKIKTALMKGADPRSIPPSIALLLAVSDPRVKEAIAMRQGAKNQAALDQGRQQPQRTVLDDEMAGLAGLETDMDYASGGIVAFEGGGGVDALARELDEARAAAYGMRAPGLLQRRRDPAAMETYNQAIQRLRAAETAYQTGIGSQVPAAFGRATRTPMDVPAPAGLPAALPASMVPSTVGEPEQPATGPTSIVRPPARLDRDQQHTRAAAIPAAQATATAGQSIKPEASLLYTGESPEAAFARKEAEMNMRFPSEMREHVAELKEQAQQAVKDRDSDRWLAAANGFFAMAAGTSPYALKNFAEGAGVAVKDLVNVNKDYRKTQDLLKKAEREERKVDRLENMQKYDAADKARTRVEDITRQAREADARYKAKLEELSIKRTGLDVEREKVKAYNRTPAEIQLVERVAKEKNIPFSEALSLVAGTKREPITREKAMSDYTKNSLLLRDQYPTFDSYWNALHGGQGSSPTKTPKQPLTAFDR